MGFFWKKLFFLDFQDSFFLSNLRLFLFLNPLWTLVVSVALGDRSPASILFRWGWNFLEATLVCLLGMALIRSYVWAEAFLARARSRPGPRHGTGWYLLFLAFLAPPGLVVALRIMVGAINYFYAGDPIAPSFQWQYYGKELFWVWLLLLAAFLFKSWYDLRESARSNLLRAEGLEKERLRALLTKLQDQMNPHFLFNTLNTVAALIPQDPQKAEKVVIQLSSLLQGVLTATRRTRHSLAQELEFCRDYLEIEQARFGPRLKVAFKVEKGLDPARAQVPVLLLQPLIENAVKHGLSSLASGGKVQLLARKDGERVEVRVEDDGVGFGRSPYSGSGTALENGRKRLELEFGKEASLSIGPREPKGTRVVVRFPLVEEEQTKEGEAHARPDRR